MKNQEIFLFFSIYPRFTGSTRYRGKIMHGKEYDTAKVRIIIDDIMSFLQVKVAEGRGYYERLLHLDEQFREVSTQIDYEVLIHDSIKLRYDLSHFLDKDMLSLDPALSTVLKEKINLNKGLSFFSALIDFDELSEQQILSAKERLSILQIKTALPLDKAEAAIAFINVIKQLKDVANIINTEAVKIKAQLHQHPTNIVIDGIDEITTRLNDAFQGLLKTTLVYPEDEETAGAIIKYLDVNPHIRKILQAFDFHEGLEDSLLDARASNALASAGRNGN